MNNLIEHVELSIQNAINNISKINNDVINVEGMSGIKTRHLYNNICSYKKSNNEKLKYLEIGTWKGSSLISALYKNEENVLCTFIDNFSEFNPEGNIKKILFDNIHNILEENIENKFQFIDKDCFSINLNELIYNKYDVYLYDGGHSSENHIKAITYFWESLSDECVIIIDDWCHHHIREATFKSFSEKNAHIIYMKEIQNPSGPYGFWDGCGIFIIKK